MWQRPFVGGPCTTRGRRAPALRQVTVLLLHEIASTVPCGRWCRCSRLPQETCESLAHHSGGECLYRDARQSNQGRSTFEPNRGECGALEEPSTQAIACHLPVPRRPRHDEVAGQLAARHHRFLPSAVPWENAATYGAPSVAFGKWQVKPKRCGLPHRRTPSHQGNAGHANCPNLGPQGRNRIENWKKTKETWDFRLASLLCYPRWGRLS